MLSTFSSITPYLKFNPKRVSIDNFCFKLHYRFTFIILIIATILVTSRQYIGEHIKCISDTIPERVINTFCFVTTTFTVVRHLNNTALDSGAIFQPGIGPYQVREDPIKRHAYYQWVPFVLFGQALCFLVPHYLWKHWEGGRIKKLVFGLKMVGLARYIKNHSRQIGKLEILSAEETELRIRDIRHEVVNRMRLNRQWGIHLMIAEWLNWFNIVFQIWWTNKFLGGQFYGLGWKIINEKWNTRMDVLDVVFPKVTKCHFNKFGPSGSLQTHDTLCVMALNIINEKIYTILWFWFFFVLVMSSFAVIWRFFTLFMFKNQKFSEIVFSQAKPGRRLDKHNLETVVRRCNFSNWMFLYFVATNLSEFLFNKVIDHLSDEISPSPNFQNKVNQNKDPDSEVGPSRALLLDMVDGPMESKEKEAEKVD